MNIQDLYILWNHSLIELKPCQNITPLSFFLTKLAQPVKIILSGGRNSLIRKHGENPSQPPLLWGRRKPKKPLGNREGGWVGWSQVRRLARNNRTEGSLCHVENISFSLDSSKCSIHIYFFMKEIFFKISSFRFIWILRKIFLSK